MRPQTSSKQDANDRRLAGLPSLEVVNLQIQLAQATAEKQQAVADMEEAKKALGLLQQQCEAESAQLQAMKKDSDSAEEECNRANARVAELETLVEEQREQAEQQAAAHDAQLTQMKADHEGQAREWNLRKDTYELKVREMTMRGSGTANENTELKAEIEALKTEGSTVRQQLVERHGRILSLEKQLSGQQQSASESGAAQSQQIEQLQNQLKVASTDLAVARQELTSIRLEERVKGEEAIERKLIEALEDSKKECETMLAQQKQQFEKQIHQLESDSSSQLSDSKAETDHWRARAQTEQEKLASQIEENNSLRQDIMTRDQELARLEQVNNSEELRRRLESLKEVVTHTLREKADLEEEVLHMKERLTTQQQRGSVIQDLQDRLKMVKDMNARLDQDNEELRLKLQSAQNNLRHTHEQNSNLGRAPSTAGARSTSRFPNATGNKPAKFGGKDAGGRTTRMLRVHQ